MIERVEMPDPYNDEFTIVRWSATCNGVGGYYDTLEAARAFIEKRQRETAQSGERMAAA